MSSGSAKFEDNDTKKVRNYNEPYSANSSNTSNALNMLNDYIESTQQRKKDLGVDHQTHNIQQLTTENELLKAQVSRLKSELLKYIQLGELNSIMKQITVSEGISQQVLKTNIADGDALSVNTSPSSAIAPPWSANRRQRAGGSALNLDDSEVDSISSSIQLSPDKSSLYDTHDDTFLKPALNPFIPKFELQPPPVERQVRNPITTPDLQTSAVFDNNDASHSKPAASAVYTSSRIHISASPGQHKNLPRKDSELNSSEEHINSTPTRLKVVEDLSKFMVPGSASSSQYNTSMQESSIKQQILLSPQESPTRANRLTSLVGDQLHSPLRPPISVAGIKEELEETLNEHVLSNNIPDLSHDYLGSSDIDFERKNIFNYDDDTNLNSKQPDTKFSLRKEAHELGNEKTLDSVLSNDEVKSPTSFEDPNRTFGDQSADSSFLNTPKKSAKKGTLGSLNNEPPKEDNLLGSPVLINKNQQAFTPNPVIQRSASSLVEKRSMGLDQNSLRSVSRNIVTRKVSSTAGSITRNNPDSFSVISVSPNPQELNSKFNDLNYSNLPLQNQQQNSFTPSSMYSASSPKVMSPTGKVLKSNIPLFIQPDEFHTIKIQVVGTLYHDINISGSMMPVNDSSASLSGSDEDNTATKVLFAVLDRGSDKKIFQFSKTIEQIYEFNEKHLAPYIDVFSLPPLPEISSFQTKIPSKVNIRKQKLSDFFLSLFNIPELPSISLLKLAEFISTNTVTGIGLAGDNGLLESWVIMRKTKTIGSSSNWKIRYAVLSHDGKQIQLYDTNSQLSEQIKLPNSTIEIHPNIPEDKHGTYNGFVVHEPKKSGLSSSSKYYICLETSKDRELWVGTLSRLTVLPGTLKKGTATKSYTNNQSMDDVSMNTSYSGKSELGQETNHDDSSFYAESSLISDDASNKSSMLDSHTSQEYSTNNSFVSHSGASASSNANGMTEREIKRNRMRSFFPFKKSSNLEDVATSPKIPQYSSMESSIEYDSSSNNNINRTLEMMNLGGEVKSTLIFGNDLRTVVEMSSQSYQKKYIIPSVVYRCLEFLYKNQAIEEEGIFRLSGSSSVIKNLQEQFDRLHDIDICNYTELNVDMNVVTGLLKLYLRSLPHFIFGDENYERFKVVVETHSKDEKTIAIKFRDICKNYVAKENYDLMYVLFELLVNISKNSDVNKMNLRNLCIVFSPTLNVSVNMLQPFIVDFGCIFRGKEPLDPSRRETLNIYIPTMSSF